MSIGIWAAEQGARHVGFWPHAGEVGGAAPVVIGIVLGVAIGRGWWLPGGFVGVKGEAEPGGPVTAAVAEPAPVNVSVVHKVDGDRLRLVVTNEGPRGEFTAEVISVLDPDRTPVEAQSWTVPWVGDGSAVPADLLHSGSRTLDFARFVPDEGQWPHRAFWEFFSLPGPGRIAVMYKPVADKRELAPARFVVTVRIMRSDPSPDHADRQFAIGVTSNAGLVCEPVPSPATMTEDRQPAQAGSTNDPAATAQQQSLLAQVRSHLDEGRSLQGALDRAPPPTVPPGLPERIEGWEITVRAGLKSRPDLCARFEAAQFVTTQSAPDYLSNKLKARLGELETFEQELP
jgi:hypothetical protein